MASEQSEWQFQPHSHDRHPRKMNQNANYKKFDSARLKIPKVIKKIFIKLLMIDGRLGTLRYPCDQQTLMEIVFLGRMFWKINFSMPWKVSGVKKEIPIGKASWKTVCSFLKALKLRISIRS